MGWELTDDDDKLPTILLWTESCHVQKLNTALN